MHYGIERGVTFTPTRRCISSFGRAPSWYLGGGWIEATMQHHLRPTSPTAEAMRLERIKSGFKSPVGYHFACVVQRQRQQPQKLFSGCSNHPTGTIALVAQLAEADGLNPFQCRIEACLGHQFTRA